MVPSRLLICMAQLSELQVCGSPALAVSEEQARMNHPQAIRWVPTIMYSASFTSLCNADTNTVTCNIIKRKMRAQVNDVSIQETKWVVICKEMAMEFGLGNLRNGPNISSNLTLKIIEGQRLE